MNCPVGFTEKLVMSERQGIEIDYCPKCRGVWLDRGELDKIIERSTDAPKNADRASTPPPPPVDMYDSDYGKHRYKKRKNWLSDLFD